MPSLPAFARYARSTVIGWLMFFLCWGVVGAGLALAGLLMSPIRWGLVIGGLVFAALATLVLIRLQQRFRSPGPVIHITTEAYHDRRLGKPIPWSEVKDVRRHQPGRRLMLLLQIERPERFLAGRLSLASRHLNPALDFPPVISRLDGLDLPQDRIAELAEAAFAGRPQAKS